jgi:hypothetical protein
LFTAVTLHDPALIAAALMNYDDISDVSPELQAFVDKTMETMAKADGDLAELTSALQSSVASASMPPTTGALATVNEVIIYDMDALMNDGTTAHMKRKHSQSNINDLAIVAATLTTNDNQLSIAESITSVPSTTGALVPVAADQDVMDGETVLPKRMRTGSPINTDISETASLHPDMH